MCSLSLSFLCIFYIQWHIRIFIFHAEKILYVFSLKTRKNVFSVVNRELFEASGTRRPHLPSQICPTAGYGAHTYIKKDVFVFLKYE